MPKTRMTGDIVDFAVNRVENDFAEAAFGTKREAEDFCTMLNAQPGAGIGEPEGMMDELKEDVRLSTEKELNR